LTLGEYLEEWLAAGRNIRPSPFANTAGSIHNQINPRLGKVRLQAVDRLHIRAL
jgi:hypothetical protein